MPSTPITSYPPAPDGGEMMRVMHVTTGLGGGGAEAMLYKLARATQPERVVHSVVSLTDEGFFGPWLRDLGVPVTALGLRRGAFRVGALWSVARLIRRQRPDVIQGWMYHGNLLAGLAARGTRVPVVWGIHHTDVDPRHTKMLTRVTRAVSARLSGVLCARIVCCAESARRSHESIGFQSDRMVVIPNGFVIDDYKADVGACIRVRHELSIPEKAPVVALVARVHPDKDHGTFFAAARIIAAARRDVVFVLAGDGTAPEVPSLTAMINGGLRVRCRLLGRRSDIAAILAAADVLASSSRSEGFPQILGEAMLSGVPCAATDVGDSREIVGPAGRIVPPGDAPALAKAILEILALPALDRAALGDAARRRIVERYDIRAVARQYLALYRQVSR